MEYNKRQSAPSESRKLLEHVVLPHRVRLVVVVSHDAHDGEEQPDDELLVGAAAKEDEARAVVESLPVGLARLSLQFSGCSISDACARELSERIPARFRKWGNTFHFGRMVFDFRDQSNDFEL